MMPGSTPHKRAQAQIRAAASAAEKDSRHPSSSFHNRNVLSERALLKALELTDRMELAGRLGFFQTKLQTAEEQLSVLTAPATP